MEKEQIEAFYAAAEGVCRGILPLIRAAEADGNHGMVSRLLTVQMHAKRAQMAAGEFLSASSEASGK